MRSSSLREQLLDLLYPSCCAGCGSPEGYLCPRCLASLASMAQDREPVSRRARGAAFAFIGMRAGSPYEGAAREMVLRLKSSESSMARPLAALMAAAAGNDPDYIRADLVCFVPSERSRVARRGFNPAELLAREVGLLTGRPLGGVLVKTRPTPDQDSVPGERRWSNVAGAFRLAGGIPHGAGVLLVDDVLTTGATAHNCALALLGGGARSVHVLVAAEAFLRRKRLSGQDSGRIVLKSP